MKEITEALGIVEIEVTECIICMKGGLVGKVGKTHCSSPLIAFGY